MYGGTQNHDFGVFDSSCDQYVICKSSNQRVGIGTTSPYQLLSLDGGNISASRDDASMLIDLETRNVSTSHDAGIRFHKVGVHKGSLGYNAGTDTVNINYGGFDNKHINISSAGKIGIGTAVPTGSFHINTTDSLTIPVGTVS